MRSGGGLVGFGHPEGLLDLPQLVVGADHELGCGSIEVRDVALQPGQGPGLGLRSPFTASVPPDSWTNRLRFTATFPVTAFSAFAIWVSIPLRVRRARWIHQDQPQT